MSEVPCKVEYARPGGPQPGDRIVKCHLPFGHPGDHEEADTEVRWTGGEVLDPALVWPVKLRRRTPDEQLAYWQDKVHGLIAEKHDLTVRAERAEAELGVYRRFVVQIRAANNAGVVLPPGSLRQLVAGLDASLAARERHSPEARPAVVSATAVVSAPGAPNPQLDSVMADTPAPGRKATCPQCGLEPIADGYSVCEVCAFAPGRSGEEKSVEYLNGCPVEVWDGPYQLRCALGVDRCATHGPFERAKRCTEDAACRRPEHHGGRCWPRSDGEKS